MGAKEAKEDICGEPRKQGMRGDPGLGGGEGHNGEWGELGEGGSGGYKLN